MGVWPLEQLFLREEVLLESQTMCNVLSEFHTNLRQRKVLRHPNTGYQTTLRQNTVSCLACRTLGTGTFHFHYLNISYIKLFLRIHVTSLFCHFDEKHYFMVNKFNQNVVFWGFFRFSAL